MNLQQILAIRGIARSGRMQAFAFEHCVSDQGRYNNNGLGPAVGRNVGSADTITEFATRLDGYTAR